jgi:hypothetical protein
VLFTELIVAIETALIVFQDYTAGARYVAIVIDRLTIMNIFTMVASHLSHNVAEGIAYTAGPGISIPLEDRQVAGSLRSAVHLKSDFDFVTGLKGTKVVCQLLGICMLCKERCSSNLLLTSSVALGYGAAASVGARNILAANLVSVNKTVDYVACAKLNGCIAMSVAVIQRGDRKEKTVRLFATKTNCGYVALVGIHISADIIAGFVFFAEEFISFCELCGQLSISREIYAQLTFSIVSRYAYGITKHVC